MAAGWLPGLNWLAGLGWVGWLKKRSMHATPETEPPFRPPTHRSADLDGWVEEETERGVRKLYFVYFMYCIYIYICIRGSKVYLI